MMKLNTFTAFLSVLILFGCATQSSNNFPPFEPTPIGQASENVEYILKTDNLLVIADASSSTAAPYEGGGFQSTSEVSKFDAGQELLRRINQTIPEDVGLNAGLRSFGFGPCTSWQFTKLNMPVSPYSPSSFASALQDLGCNSGGSPMHKALEAAGNDLAAAEGNSGILIVSAGHQLDADPIPAARKLKQQYGDRLCIYTIFVGNEASQAGRRRMYDLATIGECGFAVNAADIAASPAMADYVKKVLFIEQPIAQQALQDTDGDGVADYEDECNKTPDGAKVNKQGCWAYHGVFFDFDKSVIKPEYYDLFDNAVLVMEANPNLQVQIEGHTDSIGSESYNQKLSERRAKAVKDFIVGKGISADRMTTVGFGESHPIKDNHFEEGRSYNRRVEFEITAR